MDEAKGVGLMGDLLASAHTIQGITACCREFYFNTPIKLVPYELAAWKIVRLSDAKVLPGTVKKRANRYRFEGEVMKK